MAIRESTAPTRSAGRCTRTVGVSTMRTPWSAGARPTRPRWRWAGGLDMVASLGPGGLCPKVLTQSKVSTSLDSGHRRRCVDRRSARLGGAGDDPVSYTHLRAHETGRNLVCRLLLEKKK